MRSSDSGDASFNGYRVCLLSNNPAETVELRAQDFKNVLTEAFAVVLRGLIEALIANGSLISEQAQTLLRHSDLKTAFAIWDGLEGEMPDAELRRMEQQATRFLDGLRRDIFPRARKPN